VIVLTNQCAGGQRLGPCHTDEPFDLATGIAAFYEPEYGLISRMGAETDPNPRCTEKLFDFLAAPVEPSELWSQRSSATVRRWICRRHADNKNVR